MNQWLVLVCAQVVLEFAAAIILTFAGVAYWKRVAICTAIGMAVGLPFLWWWR